MTLSKPGKLIVESMDGRSNGETFWFKNSKLRPAVISGTQPW